MPLSTPEEETSALDGENFEVVVKNTFIQVSEDAPDRNGLSTAPASLHRAGVMQRSLLAAEGSTRTPADSDHKESEDALRGISESPLTGTSTTAASTPPTPSQSDLVPATPAHDAGDVCLWPPTPASPRRTRVSLSLVDLTEEPAPAAAGAGTPSIYNFNGAGGMPPPTEAPARFAPGPALLPPPPMEPPKLPPGVGSEGLQVSDGGLAFGPPLCGPPPLGKNNEPIMACFANAPVPRYAPPSSPAPEPLPSEDAFRGPPPMASATD